MAGFTSLMLAFAMMFGVMVAPASATVTGCNWYKWGQFCLTVNGGKTYVKNVHPMFASANDRCNWDVSAEFFDSSNKWYRTERSRVHYGCSRVNFDDIWINADMRRGYVCSTLRENGGAVANRCEAIH